MVLFPFLTGGLSKVTFSTKGAKMRRHGTKYGARVPTFFTVLYRNNVHMPAKKSHALKSNHFDAGTPLIQSPGIPGYGSGFFTAGNYCPGLQSVNLLIDRLHILP